MLDPKLILLPNSEDPWLADDKFAHAGLGGLVMLALLKVLPLPEAALSLFALGVAWEALELARYWLWYKRGSPGSWPIAADLASWRDVVANMAGGAIAAVLA